MSSSENYFKDSYQSSPGLTDKYLYNYSLKYNYKYTDKYVRSGRLYMLNGIDYDCDSDMVSVLTPSRHFTFIFNTFVMM